MKVKTKYFKRHDDDEIIDEIVFKVVPRYKESELSGDEWRVSTQVELKRKGEVMISETYCSMKDAASHLPWLLLTWIETLDEEHRKIWSDRIKKDETTCHQPGCSAPATVMYSMKKEYSREGFSKDLTDHYWDMVRMFCDRHSRRGDCGLEDADDNYRKVEK